MLMPIPNRTSCAVTGFVTKPPLSGFASFSSDVEPTKAPNPKRPAIMEEPKNPRDILRSIELSPTISKSGETG